jgi:hypothetical protein
MPRLAGVLLVSIVERVLASKLLRNYFTNLDRYSIVHESGLLPS